MATRPHELSFLLPIARRLFIICHLTALICLAACTRSGEGWNRVLERGVLRVGMDASFPPFESIGAEGVLVGFDVDLARELARRLGVEVQFAANLPYDGLLDALLVDQVDVVISALVVSPKRMADFSYSVSYFDAGQVLVTRDGSGIETTSDLRGRSLAVELGTRGDLEARAWMRSSPDLKIVHCETAVAAVIAVATGAADAALVDHVSALLSVDAGETGIVVGSPLVEEPYAVAVRRESRDLLRAIDEALTDMKEDGTLTKLTGQWMSVH